MDEEDNEDTITMVGVVPEWSSQGGLLKVRYRAC